MKSRSSSEVAGSSSTVSTNTLSVPSASSSSLVFLVPRAVTQLTTILSTCLPSSGVTVKVIFRRSWEISGCSTLPPSVSATRTAYLPPFWYSTSASASSSFSSSLSSFFSSSSSSVPAPSAVLTTTVLALAATSSLPPASMTLPSISALLLFRTTATASAPVIWAAALLDSSSSSSSFASHSQPKVTSVAFFGMVTT